MAITVMIVEDEDSARNYIGEYLVGKGYEVIGAATLKECRDYLSRGTGDVIVLDVNLPDGYGPNLLYETINMPMRPPIIIITVSADIEMAVDVMKNGALDFILKPIPFARLEQSLQRASEIVSMRRELSHMHRAMQLKDDFVAGKSPAMQAVLSHAQRAAAASVSVLVTGETGTGKEVLAKFIRRMGPRQNKPFVDINCAAIQSTMLESELFGYEAGAFTGAEKRKIGLMEVADGGILFLDEISSMPLDIQAKILRAVEERSFRRVGGTKLIPVDVQVVAASNRDLKVMMSKGEFREDLYFRLKVVDLTLPPLRERKADIPELVGYFIKLINGRRGLNIQEISPSAMGMLMNYSWPGNIRELSNAIERAMLFCDERVIDVSNLPMEITVSG